MESLYALLIGLAGAGAMSLLLYLIAQAGADELAGVRGIGSSIPTQATGSLVPGMLVHGAAGILFAYGYAALGHALSYPLPWQLLLLGAAIGLVRGLVVSAVLGLLAFDQAPLERMAQAGPAVGTIHVLANALYGVTVSALFGLTRADVLLAF